MVSSGPLLAGTVPFSYSVYMMGMATIEEHFRMVANFLVNGTPGIKRARMQRYYVKDLAESVAFIQGTGLEIVVRAYVSQEMPSVDAETLRETFYEMVDYWKRKSAHQQSA